MIYANMPVKASPKASLQGDQEKEHQETIAKWKRDFNAASALAKQTGGNHYKNMAIQPAEYSEKNGLSLLEGNVVKYISRWKKKGGVEDLNKAVHCIELLIEIHGATNEDV